MTQPSIKGIIWDFGNILATFDHLKACSQFAEYCALAPKEIHEKFFLGERTPAKLHESGEISSQEFFRLTQELMNFSEDLSFQKFCDIWKDIFRENEGVAAVIENIPTDLKQCILSNTDPIHWQAIEQLSVMKKYFSNPTRLVRSYTSRTRKPDVKMYQDALNALQLGQAEIAHILYIEDISEYREAFEQMGGNTLSYDCSKDSLEQLEIGLRKFNIL